VALLEFIIDYWYWAAIFYGLAFAILVSLVVSDGLRDERAKLAAQRAADLGADSGADSDSDSDEQCRTNLVRSLGRKPGHRSIQRRHGYVRLGRHVPGSDSVLESEKAVA
jgi:hypothetical protein